MRNDRAYINEVKSVQWDGNGKAVGFFAESALDKLEKSSLKDTVVIVEKHRLGTIVGTVGKAVNDGQDIAVGWSSNCRLGSAIGQALKIDSEKVARFVGQRGGWDVNSVVGLASGLSEAQRFGWKVVCVVVVG
jgi:hypothetical protein